MKNRIRLIVFLNLFIGCFTNTFSQTEASLSFMDNVYQSTYYSPFNNSEFKASIGLPGLSSMYGNITHTGFAMADFYPNGLGQAIDPNDVLSKMDDVEYLGATAQVDLFHFFYQKGSQGFSFHVNENISAKVSYASAPLRLAWKGNGDFVGEELDLSGTGVDIQHYREYALGYYKNWKKWQFAGKVKFLYGKGSISTETSNFKMNISDDIYQHSTEVDYRFNGGGFDFGRFEDSTENEADVAREYMLNNKNKGFAMDLGASYQFSDKLQFNAALTNVGAIKWKESVYNYSINEKAYINGVDVLAYAFDSYDSDTMDIEDYILADYPDSLKVDSSRAAYKTSTPWNLALGARYDFYKGTYVVGRLNLNSYKGLRSQLTVGVYHDLYRWFNIGITNTIANGKVFNPGVALVLKPGPVQFYIATDALNAVRFMSAKQVSIRFGMNLVFGHMKDQEKITSVAH